MTYFDIKGVAEKVRLAFVLAGVPFDDQRISFSDWAELKATTRYGQLPCLRAGGDELYQSGAMLKYVALAEEERLYPIADLAKCVHIEEVLGVLDDLARAWRPCVAVVSRPQDYGHPADLDAAAKDALAKTLRENFLANELPKYMAFLSAHIAAYVSVELRGMIEEEEAALDELRACGVELAAAGGAGAKEEGGAATGAKSQVMRGAHARATRRGGAAGARRVPDVWICMVTWWN